jgi:hypothetical protein
LRLASMLHMHTVFPPVTFEAAVRDAAAGMVAPPPLPSRKLLSPDIRRRRRTAAARSPRTVKWSLRSSDRRQLSTRVADDLAGAATTAHRWTTSTA